MIRAYTMREHIKDLRAKLRRLRSQETPGEAWIPCKQKMPEDGDAVLVSDADRSVHMAWYRANGGSYAFDCDTYGLSAEEAIYWQPKPIAPPLQEDKESR